MKESNEIDFLQYLEDLQSKTMPTDADGIIKLSNEIKAKYILYYTEKVRTLATELQTRIQNSESSDYSAFTPHGIIKSFFANPEALKSVLLQALQKIKGAPTEYISIPFYNFDFKNDSSFSQYIQRVKSSLNISEVNFIQNYLPKASPQFYDILTTQDLAKIYIENYNKAKRLIELENNKAVLTQNDIAKEINKIGNDAKAEYEKYFRINIMLFFSIGFLISGAFVEFYINIASKTFSLNHWAIYILIALFSILLTLNDSSFEILIPRKKESSSNSKTKAWLQFLFLFTCAFLLCIISLFIFENFNLNIKHKKIPDIIDFIITRLPLTIICFLTLSLSMKRYFQAYNRYVYFTHLGQILNAMVIYSYSSEASTEVKQEFIRKGMEALTRNPFEALSGAKKKGVSMGELKEISSILNVNVNKNLN